MGQKEGNFYWTAREILKSGISMGEPQEPQHEPLRKPLQRVDLYYIADDGRVHLTNSTGGLASEICGTVEAAQSWVAEVYPEAKPLTSLDELHQIANQRCEEYLSRKL